MTEVVPRELVGVWQRESLQINADPCFEDSRVIWLQTPSRYADIRVSQPGGNALPEAIGGPLEWNAPALTFHHGLDFSGRHPEDIGFISWDGETLIEEGSVALDGVDVDYRERWIRRTGPNPQCQSLEARDSHDALMAIALRIDDHAVLIAKQKKFQASYFMRVNSHWCLQWCIGEELEHLLPVFGPAETCTRDILSWREVA
ncbi:MAG: hypothetical protein O7F73_17050 [Gammaproteobacteria bacterium]|nr:hypothetical protein [Gammaproteobacteria bacterium]